ncbi:hypothetical protein SKAU_G00198130 [Synaphobranchus kaupii]|uniref:Uncharacterized protein n=1 Tax=Synaphobranchus kaupii TaxID=118154 RepID=A0A9Q1FF04_SYNKA|nr:hypothetical protein SKAU_G00198130 [Synaphobranchus kaupii]
MAVSRGTRRWPDINGPAAARPSPLRLVPLNFSSRCAISSQRGRANISERRCAGKSIAAAKARSHRRGGGPVSGEDGGLPRHSPLAGHQRPCGSSAKSLRLVPLNFSSRCAISSQRGRANISERLWECYLNVALHASGGRGQASVARPDWVGAER